MRLGQQHLTCVLHHSVCIQRRDKSVPLLQCPPSLTDKEHSQVCFKETHCFALLQFVAAAAKAVMVPPLQCLFMAPLPVILHLCCQSNEQSQQHMLTLSTN